MDGPQPNQQFEPAPQDISLKPGRFCCGALRMGYQQVSFGRLSLGVIELWQPQEGK